MDLFCCSVFTFPRGLGSVAHEPSGLERTRASWRLANYRLGTCFLLCFYVSSRLWAESGVCLHGVINDERSGQGCQSFSLVFIFSRDLVILGACGVSRQGCPRPSQRTEIYLSSLLCSVFVVPGSKRQEPEMTIWVSLMPETTTSLSQTQTKQRITQVT